ncbi:hypothetical protein GBAR_LOCUS14035 [Geodia barretti]|uniref:Uncharacterized protein n=1 Tax=Geodia barretti TaxID=519541 RepID=A0AA35S606_GEOBA|nr:hypothetical protein GBAR_LOCUS14035 [Geodia barretti]
MNRAWTEDPHMLSSSIHVFVTERLGDIQVRAGAMNMVYTEEELTDTAIIFIMQAQGTR